MATSPTSKSALLSGAAKDDSLGADGTFTFKIADLLANDPGGAAKVDVSSQFFFGTTAADQADQATYLSEHGITNNGDGTYTIGADGIDFDYFVQIGNKGTWSTAHVDVTAPEDVVVEPHTGGNLFTENFDSIPAENVIVASGNVWEQVNLDAAHGWTGGAYSELGANGYLNVPTTSGAPGDAFWFDTQQSPGPVNLSHAFTDTTAAVDGKTATLSFDIAKQDFDGHVTPANETFEFRIDNVAVASFTATDLDNAGEMYHFNVDLAGYANAGDNHTLSLVDTSGFGFVGFAIDSIQINDWIV